MPSWLTPELIRRLEALRLSVRWVRSGRMLGGRFPINRRGSSVEFADHTPYYPGDDIRAIDWSLYARLDRLFIKTYREEITLAVEVLVDATASMGLPTPEKFARAGRLAVCLGYVALAGGHHVRLNWIAPGPLAASPWFHRRYDLFRLAQQAEARRPEGQADLADWMRRASLALRMHGGQAIVLTDGMMPPAQLFRALQTLLVRNLEVKVIQVLTPQELHPARLVRGSTIVDVESGSTHQLAYSPAQLARAVAEHNELLARFCAKHTVRFVQHRLDEPLERFVTRTLPAHGFLE